MLRDMIMHRLYGEHTGDTNVIDVNIKNIRRKIAALSPETYIETVRGKGYIVRSSIRANQRDNSHKGENP